MGSADGCAHPPDVSGASPAVDRAAFEPKERSVAPMPAPDVQPPVVTVLDWDDTLCPTYWLLRRGLLALKGMLGPAAQEAAELKAAPMTDDEARRLALLEDHALALLQRAAAHGPVFIITAARVNWLVACAFHFMPRVHALLAGVHPDGALQVVSAREWYQQNVAAEQLAKDPLADHKALRGDPLAWKTATFEALCAHLQLQELARRRGQRTDLLSIGDSTFEREACARMEMRGPGIVRSKTLKLTDNPTLHELLDQLAMTLSLLDKMCLHDASLHLQVTRNPPPHSPSSPPLQLTQISLGINANVGVHASPGSAEGSHSPLSKLSRTGTTSPLDAATPLVAPVPSGRT